MVLRLWGSAVFGAALLAATTAQGQGMPYYDTNRYCQETSAGSYYLEAVCRESEHSAREAVQSVSVPPEIWRYCNSSVGSTSSYYLLQNCIESEEGAKRALGYSNSPNALLIVVPPQAGAVSHAAPMLRSKDPREQSLCRPPYHMTERDGCQR